MSDNNMYEQWLREYYNEQGDKYDRSRRAYEGLINKRTSYARGLQAMTNTYLEVINLLGMKITNLLESEAGEVK